MKTRRKLSLVEQPTRPFTRSEAVFAANALLPLPGVGEVHLFGLLAQDEHQHDSVINILLVAERSLYEKYRDLLNEGIQRDESPKIRQQRIALGYVCRYSISLASIYDQLEESLRRKDIGDGLYILLVPQDWQKRLPQIQKELPLNDPNFMEDVSKSSKKVAYKY